MKLDSKECVVLGTSGGAAVALLMAIHLGSKVRAVIADSCGRSIPLEIARRYVSEERQRRNPEQIQFWTLAHGRDWEQVVEADTNMLMRFAESGGDWFEDRLGDIRCPVLLTAGQNDGTLPRAATQLGALYERIPTARLYLHDAGEHPLMWSCPEDFRCISDCFLQAVERRSQR